MIIIYHIWGGGTLSDIQNFAKKHKILSSKRVGISKIESELQTPKEKLSLHANWHSPSDTWHLRNLSEPRSWNEINYFDAFKETSDLSRFMGEFGTKLNPDSFKSLYIKLSQTAAPSTVGVVAKEWLYKDDEMFLRKCDEDDQIILNECVGDFVNEELGLFNTKRHLEFHKGEDGVIRPYVYAKVFTDKDTDFVTAGAILTTTQTKGQETKKQRFFRTVKGLYVPEETAKKGWSEIVLADSITGNYDRHFFNFGFLHNANERKIEGWAPNFDNDASMWDDSDIAIVNGTKTFVTSDRIKGQGRQKVARKNPDMVENFYSAAFLSTMNEELTDQIKCDPETFKAILDNMGKKKNRIKEFVYETYKTNGIDQERSELLATSIGRRLDITSEIIKAN